MAHESAVLDSVAWDWDSCVMGCIKGSLSLPEQHRPKTEIFFGRCSLLRKIVATDKFDAGCS